MKPDEGLGGLDDNFKDYDPGGGKAAGVRIFLQSCCPVGVALWYRDVGG